MLKLKTWNMATPNCYEGYRDRNDYLACLADSMEIDLETVKTLADLLGPNEDFDGLVTTLEDYANL
jgi:hypothetical protein